MTTPVLDFVRAYAQSDTLRLHMPGHKGRGPLGCEPWDITEIAGADALYEASGILAESEANSAALFGSRRTLYSTEGSSQCIRAMVHLAVTCRGAGREPLLLAARNVHKAFVQAAALTDAEVRWLWPEGGTESLMSCGITPAVLDLALAEHPGCCGVYVTSPDYLGQRQDIRGLAAVCRGREVPLLVDNAHGAYLHFLPEPCHPLDLGAAMCCDSAHKTFPVLTGGAYLHIAEGASEEIAAQAKSAMALYGSTSPSYLTLASLDACNAMLAGDYRERLALAQGQLARVRDILRAAGWDAAESDPLRITIRGDSAEAVARLRASGAEPEYAGADALVLLFAPEQLPEAGERVTYILGRNPRRGAGEPAFPGYGAAPEQAMRIREAVFAPQEFVPAAVSRGRIAAAPTCSCPPAVPVVMPGERITEEMARLLEFYGYEQVCVVK